MAPSPSSSAGQGNPAGIPVLEQKLKNARMISAAR